MGNQDRPILLSMEVQDGVSGGFMGMSTGKAVIAEVLDTRTFSDSDNVRFALQTHTASYYNWGQSVFTGTHAYSDALGSGGYDPHAWTKQGSVYTCTFWFGTMSGDDVVRVHTSENSPGAQGQSNWSVAGEHGDANREQVVDWDVAGYTWDAILYKYDSIPASAGTQQFSRGSQIKITTGGQESGVVIWAQPPGQTTLIADYPSETNDEYSYAVTLSPSCSDQSAYQSTLDAEPGLSLIHI